VLVLLDRRELVAAVTGFWPAERIVVVMTVVVCIFVVVTAIDELLLMTANDL
jgi:hypothetical protein